MMILRALHFVRFLSISFLLSLSSAPERITKGKRIFREGFRDLRTDRDSYLPPSPFLSLLLSLSFSLFQDPFFLCVISLPFAGKQKVFFFSSSQLGFVCAGGIKKDSLYLRKVIDRYIIRTARYLLECHHVIDKTMKHVYTRLHPYTYTHTHTHSPEIWKEKRRCYGQPTCFIWCVFSYLVSCVCVCA